MKKQNTPKRPLSPHEHIKRLYYAMFTLTISMGIANITYLLLQPEHTIRAVLFCALQYCTMLLLLTAPIILRKRFLVNIPLVIIVTFAMFAFVAMILGDGLNFYGRYPWWDSGLHLLSGIILALVGLWILHILFDANDSSNILQNRFFIPLYLLLFGLACGAIWEIMEYTFDDLFGTNTQQFMQSTTASIVSENDIPLEGHEALRDTMTDLTLDFIGSLLVAIYVFINHSKLLARHEEITQQIPRK